MTTPPQPPLKSGFLAFHGNRAEDLVEVMANWVRRHPVGPLQEDVILVQSNGMAEWVKMEMARISGVCAATRVELPARFLWRTYRQVLGRAAVAAESPLDKIPMVWRLMQLLPGLLGQAVFAPVAGFLRADEPDRLLQLANQLADLFDQYQNYRPDWLEAWAGGQDQLFVVAGGVQALPPEQQWQAALWRALLQGLSPAQQQGIRPRLHQQVLARLASAQPPAEALAPRVIAFGMSQVAWTTLELLAALAPHSQVVLAIPNPCRFYWGDIMDGRELLHSLRRRQALRPGRDLATLALEDMHTEANPLLAAWGRQGRDFIRQLDVFDDAQASRQRFGIERIDLFDETEETAHTPLLKQVQNRIRDLAPLPGPEARSAAAPVPDSDRSMVFHLAHSPVRELEILHDQLLQLLAQAPLGPGAPAALNPRDVIVMVPDIEPMAPAIRAVFGQYKPTDPRFIPFDIADMGAKSNSPLIAALQWLLRLPQQRCRMSELLELLEVAAVAACFGIEPASLPKLTRWMAGAGIRWGLNQGHRTDLGLQACGDQNSAWFGLQRMLLGYASGADEVDLRAAGLPAIEPYVEVGGLEAELAGALAHLLQALANWVLAAAVPAAPAVWAARGRALLSELFKAESQADKQALQALEDALATWQLACEQASFSQDLSLEVARSAWLDALELPGLNQRFKAGGVTFCTLMPMRAIPFEVVCLLGMNDGDYPRRSQRTDFDLMGLPGMARPGDRSRREDDRQLMLEALLSARRLLYLSWCGRSVRDNSLQAPSVLVSQLMDYLSAGWGPALVEQRTTHHPLQAFSRRYFELGTPLITYAREWRAAHQQPAASAAEALARHPPLPPFVPDPGVPLTLAQLSHFLRQPVKAFFRHRLRVVFDEQTSGVDDDECFEVDRLQDYGLVRELLAKATAQPGQDARQSRVARALSRVRLAGELPMAALGGNKQQALQALVHTMLQAWHAAQDRFGLAAPRVSIRLQVDGVLLQDWVDHLLQAKPSAQAQQPADLPVATHAWLELEPGRLLTNTKKPSARPEKLLAHWVRSLAIAASGRLAQGVVVGRDGVLEIAPMEQDQAQATLSMLLRVWLDGMQAPLPLPPKTALAWVAGKDAAGQYQGSPDSPQQIADVSEACLARVFPDFEALCADGRFAILAEQVYAPLLTWAKQHVSAYRHAGEPAPDTADDLGDA